VSNLESAYTDATISLRLYLLVRWHMLRGYSLSDSWSLDFWS